MHQLPTEEALNPVRLYHREQVAQTDRDHFGHTLAQPLRWTSSLASLTEIPVCLALQLIFMMGLLAGLVAVAAR